MGIEDACALGNWSRACRTISTRPCAAMRIACAAHRRAVLGSRERAKLNHLPSRWARLKRDVRYLTRRVLYPDGTAHRVAWLYGYDVAAEEHYA